MSATNFLKLVKKKLQTGSLRFSKGPASIQSVAVCGGSGGELINEAASRGADAMITADLKYHTFQEFEEKILLIDAGHYETEHHVLPVVGNKIREIIKGKTSSAKVFITEHTTNPIQYI